jgi:hypothetical protein
MDVSPELKDRMTEIYGEETTAAGIETAQRLFEEAEKVLKTSRDSPLEEQTAELRDIVKRLLCSAWVQDRILHTVASEPTNTNARINALEQEIRALRYKYARITDPFEDEDEPAALTDFLRGQVRAHNT